MPTSELRTHASYLRRLSEVVLPASAIAKLRALLASDGPFADPDERALIARVLRANPLVALTLPPATLNRKVDQLVVLMELAAPPPAKAGGKAAAAAAAAGAAARLVVLRVAAREGTTASR
ncbi:hypothetical protein GPECTOR_20g548 [Gonium pectorale]|uniref:Uncharacterized protein n=1 Tax=Gonium pectorale TaxID=33097 RepID=A0A150GIQ4_GONPE|nr:hypothetical protein GPECTOR_20g548 [Gonium pectorale]|eukprot:KXZ49691.1 hypothetical protein GPECTOR_20g548 [Gonium pectorale]